MASIHLGNAIWDLIYPVGSVYLSTDASFDPNNHFYGTWNSTDLMGYALVGANVDEDPSIPDSRLSLTVGEAYGEKTHTLTKNEMPAHAHRVWTNTNGSGYFGVTGKEPSASDLPYGRMSETVGGDQPHNNVQPSIGVACWRRTA